MSDAAQARIPANEEAEAAAQVDDWEIEEILTRYDQVSERGATRAGGTTSCH